MRFFIVPDMLRYEILSNFFFQFSCLSGQEVKAQQTDYFRNAPMFRSRGTRGRGVGLARGRATVNRARGQRGPRGGA